MRGLFVAVVVGFTVFAVVIRVFRILLGRGLGLRLPAAGVDLLLFLLGDGAGVFPLGRARARQGRQHQGGQQHQRDYALSHSHGGLLYSR